MNDFLFYNQLSKTFLAYNGLTHEDQPSAKSILQETGIQKVSMERINKQERARVQ